MGLKPRATSKSTDLKTKPTGTSVRGFIDKLEPSRRQECDTLLAMMKQVTGSAPRMWGSSIIGFGSYHYKYASGREGDWMRTGFSPRKAAMTVYLMPGFKEQTDLLERLGPHKHSVSCLYIKKLEQVDLAVLEAMIERSCEQMTRIYGKGEGI